MNIEQIFMDCHGAVSMADIVSLEDIYFDPSIVKRIGLPESPDEFINYLGVELSNLYFNNAGIFNRFTYVKGFVMVEIDSFNLEILKISKVKERIEQQTKRMDKLQEDGRWDLIFTIMEKKMLLPKFVELHRDLPKDQIVDIFSELWVRSEFGFDMITEDILEYVYSHKVFSEGYGKRREKLLYMADEEGYLTIYHGVTSEGVGDDLSWSLSKETAQWFANRFGNNGEIEKAKVFVDHVIDYFDWRGESEVLILPQDVIR